MINITVYSFNFAGLARLSQQKAINFVTSLLVDIALFQFSPHGDFRLAVWGGVTIKLTFLLRGLRERTRIRRQETDIGIAIFSFVKVRKRIYNFGEKSSIREAACYGNDVARRTNFEFSD